MTSLIPFPQLQPGKPLAWGLVRGWPFYEGAGSKINDVSPAQTIGTMAQADQAGKWQGGRNGYSLNFDGTDDSVSFSPEVAARTILVRASYDTTGGRLLSVNGTGGYYIGPNGLLSGPGVSSSSTYINGVPVSSVSVGSELITNGTFETGVMSPWFESYSGGAAGSVATTTSGVYAGTYSATQVVTNGGSVNTNVQIFHDSTFTITSGNIYRIQFAVKGSAAKQGLQCTLRIYGSPYTAMHALLTFDITTSWVLHTFYVKANVTNAASTFFIYHGNLGAYTLSLDNVSVQQVTAVTPAISANIPYHIAVALPASTTISTLTLGKSYDASVADGHFDGQVDELRLYSQLLNQSSIAQIYAGHG